MEKCKRLATVAFFALSWLFLLLVSGTARADIYFPHVACDGQWGTEICLLNNGSTSPVSGTLTAYSNSGSAGQSINITLAANQRREINVATEMSNPSGIGYMIFATEAGGLSGYTKFFQYGQARVAVPAATNADSETMYLSHIASDSSWWTGLSLVNVGSGSKTLNFAFNSGETRSLTLAAGEHKVVTIGSLFGVSSKPGISAGSISNCRDIVGLELFGSGYQLSGVILSGKQADAITVAHVVTDASWWTGIVAYNPSATTTANLTIRPYTAAGIPLTTGSSSLAPGQKYVGTPATLGLPAGTAWFSISSSAAITSLELFGSADGRQLAGYGLVEIGRASGVFPKIDKQGWTGIALVNPLATIAGVELFAYDNYGNQVAYRSLALSPHSKLLGTPDVLLGGQNLSSATYVKYVSDQEIVGFQLNGDNSGMMLDALSALGAAAASSSGDELPTDIADNVEYVLSLVAFNDELTSTMSETLSLVMTALLADPASSRCPQITRTPATISLTSPPANISVVMDFGSGCRLDGKATQMSGRATVTVSEIVISEATGVISASFSLTAENLVRDGVPLLNGSVSGSLAMGVDQVAETIDVTVYLNFTSFESLGMTLNGDVTINAYNIDINAGAIDDALVTFDNFSTGEYTVYSGTIDLSMPSASSLLLGLNLNTDTGSVILDLSVSGDLEETAVINSTSAGTISGYDITINDLTMDPEVCADYPSSGSITLIKAGASYTMTFTDSCDGNFVLTQP